MSVPGALPIAGLSLESPVARWQELVAYARSDTVTFAFWCIVWACSFALTVIILRILFTRWGDTNVTRKTMALSLLAHLLLGMVSTRWDLPLAPRPTGSPEGEIIVRFHRRAVVDGANLPEGRMTGAGAVWNRAPEFHNRTTVHRDRRDVVAPPAVPPDRQSSPVEAPQPVSLPELPLTEKPTIPAEAERSADRKSPAVEISQGPIVEETAEGRAETGPTATAARREARLAGTASPVRVTRQARPGPGDEARIDVTPGIALSAPAIENPQATVRRSPEGNDGKLSATTEPDMAPIYDAADPAVSGGKARASESARTGQFVRSERRPVEGPGTGKVDRTPNRSQLEPTESLASRSVASRPITEEPFAEGVLPEIVRSESSGVIAKDAGKMPASYRLRGLPERKKFAIEMGATDESEQAVEASLKWLARHQHPKGYWQPIESTLGHDPDEIQISDPAERQRSGLQAESGLTALALLAFLGANYTHEDNEYADHVDRAIRWLIAQQESDGYLGGRANKYASMYCHGMATIALGEAYGMTKDEALKEPLARAIGFIVARQSSVDGGWRYNKGQAGDMSMFGWQLMALKSAHTAGLKIPIETADRAFDFLLMNGDDLKRRQLSRNGGLGAYRKRDVPKPAMTAEALFCRQILGAKRDDPAVTEAVEFIQQNLPRRSQQNLYYWYYGTLAMYHYGGEQWVRWNSAVRDNLVADQRSDGDFAGSWNPRAPWGDYGGRVFSTALSTLCLEVYYRFLPLYQISSTPDDATRTR